MHRQNKSLIKGLSILKEFMMSAEPLTANLLCQRLDIDKSTMSRLVNTLINEGFLEYVENSKEIILGDLVRNIIHSDERKKIVAKSEELLDKLFYLSEESSYIGILDHGAVLYLNQIDKSNRVLKTRDSIGLHAPLHTNAFGKILLAFGDIDLRTLELKTYTSNTITTASKLRRECEIIKKRGYAIGNEEHEYGLKSLAAPYYNSMGVFIGAVGISGLAVRLDEHRLHELGAKILKILEL